MIKTKVLVNLDNSSYFDTKSEEDITEKILREINNNDDDEDSGYTFEDCAIDFNREFVLVRGNDDKTIILHLTDGMIFESKFEDFLKEYEKDYKPFKGLTNN